MQRKRELAIGIVPFSPLGKGFFTSGPQMVEKLPENDFRKLALAWVHQQGDDVSPIPGTTKFGNFNQNVGALSVKLAPDEMAELESIAIVDAVKGDRYSSPHMALTGDLQTLHLCPLGKLNEDDLLGTRQ
ncbi:unnamed protein product [Ilex paraguariensis]|uniref:NADP-dependent oxidoreductase domain-containing protein n=1 Tax=Ilex paraguariensis TaxID=185542 RepID=A0ABC8S262_9AQUA